MADDGLRLEAWTMPHVGTLTKKFDLTKLVESLTFNDRFNDLSDGVFTIPDDAALATGILLKDRLLKVDEANHANDVGAMIRVLRGTTPILHQLVTRSEDSWSADESTTKITTEGLEWLLDRALVPAFNWTTVPPQDFMYGVESILPNPGGESSIGSNTVMTIWNDATGGTFTLSDGTDTTSALAYNVDVNTLAAALEAFASIVDVRISGAGTFAVPWVVEWINPAGVNVSLLVANDTGLTGEVVGTRIVYDTLGGQLSPTGWQKSIDPHTGVPHGQVTVLEASTDQAHTGTYSIRVVGQPFGTDFPGAQLLPSVNSGWTYRASIWVFSATATTFRLVMRTFDETFIAAVEVAVSSSTWTQLSIPSFVVPDYIDQIIFRIAPLHGSALTWYFDDWELAPGGDAAVLGLMMSDIRTAALAVGAPLGWLTPTWTTTHDSGGVAWDEPRQWVVNHGQTFLQLIEYVRRWNYEHRIRWDVADNRFEWDMWNPLGGGQARTVAITGKSGVERSGAIVRRPPTATYVLAEGEPGTVGEFASTTLDDVWGRLEKFHRDRQGVSSEELNELATRLVTYYGKNTSSRVITVGDPSLLPWTSYEPGDTLTLNLAPKDTKQVLRVAAIVVSKQPGLGTPKYDVHFGAPVYGTDTATAQGLQGGSGGSSATAQGLRTVLRRFETPSVIPQPPPATLVALPAAGTFSVFSLPGQAFVEAGRLRLRFPQAAAVLGVSLACNVAPTGAAIVADINKNGTTVFPAQAGRPSIAVSTNVSAEVAPQTKDFAAGDYLTVDVDQVGSTIPGGDLTVMVRWVWTLPT